MRRSASRASTADSRIALWAVPVAGLSVATAAYALELLSPPWALCVAIAGAALGICVAVLQKLRACERQRSACVAQLSEANAQRGYRQFVASMTHELRTPIHGIQGLADVIAAGVYGSVTDKQKDACASIKRSAQTLLALVDDVLYLARSEVDGIAARPTSIDIHELVERVTAAVSWTVGTKRIQLRTEVPPGLSRVQSDPRWLAHIVVNLVSNAVKFTPEGGWVAVRATEAAGASAVVLEVADSGIGIAREDRERIFEPFLQGDISDDKRYGGVGLGLALVARLAELLACDIELDSAVGQGATFRVTVPCQWKGLAVTRLGRPITAPPGVIAAVLDERRG